MQRFGFINNKLRFFKIGGRGDKADFVALGRIGAQIFAQALGVVLDHGIGGEQNIAHGAVVLLKLDGRFNIEFAHQRGHIAHMRAAKAIDALVVIAHGKHGRAIARHQLEPGILQLVGVLKLIHQNMVEALLVMAAQNLVGLQHFIAAQHQFGKIHHALALADFVVFGIALNQARGVQIGRLQRACAQAAFFLRIDKALQAARGDDFFGNIERLEHALDERELVAAVENLKSGRQAGIFVVHAQKAVAKPVKRAEPHAAHVYRNHGREPRLHFFGGFIGKRYRHNAVHTCLAAL